ncbi:hypothetical protein GIX45_24530 [Erwinia sp. CPCC 100877]|nr:hypothetical protein [Erwinia sp. CPCC 100877]
MEKQWNKVIEYLAEKEVAAGHYDLAVLAGNSLPYLADELVQLYREKVVSTLMLTGGKGHATFYLKKNFQQMGYNLTGQSETDLYLSYVKEKYQLPKELFLTEAHSTNSGENASFSLDVLKTTQLTPKRVLLLQDPILQRRTKATFEKEWRAMQIEFTNFVPRMPFVEKVDETFVFADQRLNGLWNKEYFISLVLGEIKRLRNDRFGYGPLGTGFIDAVQLPVDIEEAYEQLMRYYDRSAKR